MIRYSQPIKYSQPFDPAGATLQDSDVHVDQVDDDHSQQVKDLLDPPADNQD